MERPGAEPEDSKGVGMLAALTVTAFGAGIHLPRQESRIVPTKVDQTPPFDAPGVREVGPGRYVLNFGLTVLASRAPATAQIALAEAMSGPDHAPAVFDRGRPWIALAFVLIGLAYGPSLVRLAVETPFDAFGLRVW